MRCTRQEPRRKEKETRATTRTDNVDGAVAVEGHAANEKVLWLDVAVDNVLAVDVLQPRDELDGTHAHRLQREAAAAHVKEVLEAGAQQLQDEAVVFAARSKVEALWNADWGKGGGGGGQGESEAKGQGRGGWCRRPSQGQQSVKMETAGPGRADQHGERSDTQEQERERKIPRPSRRLASYSSSTRAQQCRPSSASVRQCVSPMRGRQESESEGRRRRGRKKAKRCGASSLLLTRRVRAACAEQLIEAVLQVQLRRAAVGRLELDRNVLVGVQVLACGTSDRRRREKGRKISTKKEKKKGFRKSEECGGLCAARMRCSAADAQGAHGSGGGRANAGGERGKRAAAAAKAAAERKNGQGSRGEKEKKSWSLSSRQLWRARPACSPSAGRRARRAQRRRAAQGGGGGRRRLQRQRRRRKRGNKRRKCEGAAMKPTPLQLIPPPFFFPSPLPLCFATGGAGAEGMGRRGRCCVACAIRREGAAGAGRERGREKGKGNGIRPTREKEKRGQSLVLLLLLLLLSLCGTRTEVELAKVARADALAHAEVWAEHEHAVVAAALRAAAAVRHLPPSLSLSPFSLLSLSRCRGGRGGVLALPPCPAAAAQDAAPPSVVVCLAFSRVRLVARRSPGKMAVGAARPACFAPQRAPWAQAATGACCKERARKRRARGAHGKGAPLTKGEEDDDAAAALSFIPLFWIDAAPFPRAKVAWRRRAQALAVSPVLSSLSLCS